MKQLLAIASALLISAMCVTTSSASHSRPGFHEASSTESFERHTVVRDTVLEAPPQRAPKQRIKTSATDSFGNTYSIDSSVAGVDLTQPERILDGLLHGFEIQHLRVHVVSQSEITQTCGITAVACYLADDPYTSYGGQIWFSMSDPQWQVILIHEYGHHLDNALQNIAQLRRWGFGYGCDAGSDGSRNWFFERQIEDDVLSKGFSCDPNSEWDRLLPELFAEDYSSLNGVTGWLLQSISAPTQNQLAALEYDVKYDLKTRVFNWKSRVKRRGLKTRKIRLQNWTFLRVRLFGPPRTDFDIAVYTANGTRPIRTTKRRGRNDSLLTFLPPGNYVLGVYAYGGKGAFRASVAQL